MLLLTLPVYIINSTISFDILLSISSGEYFKERVSISSGEEKNIEFTERPIVEENPTYEELKEWYTKSGLQLKKFFNTSGLLYKSLELKDKLPGMSEEEMLQLLATDGMLVKRPLLVGEEFVLVGFREADWAEKMKK